jgi:error-prone DNA polymerase
VFAELLARSCFSFLRGASHPEELVARSKELGLDAVAICDRDGLYGSVRAFSAAREVGQRVIVGAELTLASSNMERAPMRTAADVEPAVLVLLVESHQGYTNLCRLLTLSHADRPKGESALELDWLAANNEGLTAIVPAPLYLGGVDTPTPELLGRVHELFGERGLIGVHRHLDGFDAERLEAVERWSRAYALEIVASSRPLFHHRTRKPLADVMHCIRTGTTLDRAGTALAGNSEAHLRSELEMLQRFRDRPAWVERAGEVGRALCFRLDELRYHFPCQLDAGETADQKLLRLTLEGSARRYPAGVPASVAAQLEKELVLIEKLGVAPYFLSTWEVVEIARRRRILCQGRGSAANSAVCYVLGITAVDPARSSLLFERFLSAERSEPPDIDIDFEHERREEVIQEIYERYGRDRAAMVSEVICYRGKSALREVGKVFGLSLEQVDRLSGTITHWDAADVADRRLEEAGFDAGDERVRQVVMLSRMLQGFPRHLSIHVGGFVLSSRPMHEVAPVEPARMEDRTVVPWDKDDLEALGFFKVDVLGLGMLTAIRKCLALLHENGELRKHAAEPFDPLEVVTRIPAEDPAVYRMASRADTIGVFQIESRAQMAMLPRLRPRCFYDLVIEVAIVRPGPIQGGMVHPYLRRRNREEPVTVPHPALEPILERTLGVPLFQEQVMQISIVGAGYTGGEADQLRRDMAAWKKTGRLLRHRQRLLDGFAKQGIPRDFGEALFEQIKGFGEYGFPESHAASFALLVYGSAWQKAHFPAYFACALINSQPMGFYSPSAIIQDAQRHGVEVRDVSITESFWDCTLETSEPLGGRIEQEGGKAGRGIGIGSSAGQRRETHPEDERRFVNRRSSCEAPTDAAQSLEPQNLPALPPSCDLGPVKKVSTRALRLGLRLVRGFGEASARRVEAARERGPFFGVEDLVRRAALRKDEIEALAEAGALEPLVRGRRHALWRARAPRVGGLFEKLETQEPEVKLPELRPVEQLLLDYGRKGLSIADHPMRHLRPRLDKERVLSAFELEQSPRGARVAVAGLVTCRQQPGTASGVVFITLEDETGNSNLIVYRNVFEKFHHVARHATLLLARGEVERQVTQPTASAEPPNEAPSPVVHLIVRDLERLDLPSHALPSMSRDFH